MFRKKRQKREYPPGIFLPTPARIMAIIQLCLAFTGILWIAFQPFAGEIFNIKSRLLLYQDVMGIANFPGIQHSDLSRLERNARRFSALSPQKQEELKLQMSATQSGLKKTFWNKIENVFSLFAYQISKYENLWLLLSVIIPIMLLKRVEGAAIVVWILPMLVILYAYEANSQSKFSKWDEEAKLFPKESKLVSEFLHEPLSSSVFKQKKQLSLAWKRYLASKWAGVEPSFNLDALELQAEEGEYAFNIERLNRNAKSIYKTEELQKPKSMIWLVFYFLWNVLFALISNVFNTQKLRNEL